MLRGEGFPAALNIPQPPDEPSFKAWTDSDCQSVPRTQEGGQHLAIEVAAASHVGRIRE